MARPWLTFAVAAMGEDVREKNRVPSALLFRRLASDSGSGSIRGWTARAAYCNRRISGGSIHGQARATADMTLANPIRTSVRRAGRRPRRHV